MYRLIEPPEQQINSVHEDEISPEILEDVKAMETEQKQFRFEKEQKSQKMQLKVVYKDDTRVFWVNRAEDTYRTLLDMVLEEFGIE